MVFIRISQGIVVRYPHTGVLLYNPIQKTSLLMNSTGAEIIQIILSKTVVSIDYILKKIYASYPDIPYETIKIDINDCLNELHKKGFVYIGSKKDSIDVGLKQLHIEITQSCNERCVHCYIPDYVKDYHLSINSSILLKTLKEFAQIGGEEIVLTGGEPFTYPNLSNIIGFCQNHHLKVSFLTNLIDVDIDMIKELHKQGLLGFIQTSIYSMRPAIHDQITKVKQSLVKTLVNVEHLIEVGIQVNISTPIMFQNKNEIGKIIEYAQNKGIGFRASADLIEQKDGNRSFVDKYALSLAEISECYSNLVRVYGSYAFFHILHHNDCDKIFCNSPELFIENNVCSAGTDSLSIDVNGNVYPCPQWNKMILGNISVDSIRDIWCKSNILEAIRNINKRSEFPQCLRCEALSFCKNCLMKNSYGRFSQMNIPEEANCMLAHLAKHIFESKIMDNQKDI